MQKYPSTKKKMVTTLSHGRIYCQQTGTARDIKESSSGRRINYTRWESGSPKRIKNAMNTMYVGK